MVQIWCEFLGTPSIKENERLISVPSGKVSSLLYYILVNRSVTRDELAAMFWPDSSENLAKTSLRNALHKIKKLFREEVIDSPNKTMIRIANSTMLELDMEQFEAEPMSNLSLYRGEFLKGHGLKNAEEYEYWLSKTRTYYRELFIQSSLKKLSEDLKDGTFENYETNVQNLISCDPFNEEAYYYLFSFYEKTGRYDKLINEYYSMKKMLYDELGVSPEERIEKLFERSVDKIHRATKPSNKGNDRSLFYHRNYEMEFMESTFKHLIDEERSKSVIIRGEKGSGKTLFLRKFLEHHRKDALIFESKCYAMEKSISFSVWLKIFSEVAGALSNHQRKRPALWDEVLVNLFPDLSNMSGIGRKLLENRENFGHEIVSSSLREALLELAKDQPVLIVLEDLQWADPQSLELLSNLILHADDRIMFIATMSKEDSTKTNHMLANLKYVDRILLLELDRFSKSEVAQIAAHILGDKKATKTVIDELYEKSKGNALLVREFIQLYKTTNDPSQITDKVNDILEEKFSLFQVEELEVLDLISVFYTEVPLSMILKLVDYSPFTLLKIIRKLEENEVIEENQVGDETVISFMNSTYKDYINGRLNPISRKLLNLQVAQEYESVLEGGQRDITLYTKIQHHYEIAQDAIHSLKYQILILSYYLDYNHELFPELDDVAINRQIKVFIKNDKVQNSLKQMEKELLNLKNSTMSAKQCSDLEEVEMIYLLCLGRYSIREGNYTKGIKTIEKLIRMARKRNAADLLLAAYKQMIIYGIQINDTEIMIEYIILAMAIAKDTQDDRHLGMLNRLYGLYFLMKGEWPMAESYFHRAIDIFSENQLLCNSSSISVAACYNYLGEMKKAEQKYEEAAQYFKHAIDLCIDKDVSCLSIFYLNLGKTSFLQRDYESMKANLVAAKEITLQFDSYWRNALIDAYTALACFIERDYISTIQYLNSAMNQMNAINNPNDMGSVYFVQTMISLELRNYCDENSHIVREYINQPFDYYFYQTLRYLDARRDRGEIEFMKVMSKNLREE